jgi:serine/threonine-protein kinase
MPRVTQLHQTPTDGDDISLDTPRRLRLGDSLGQGNVGTVYRALLESEGRVKRPVAVKLFETVSSDERETVFSRLERLARHAAYVQHPNVVEVYEFGIAGASQPYLVTQLVEGLSLTSLLEAHGRTRKRMPLDLALFIGLEVAEALVGTRRATAPDGRRVGFAHGDLSPREVLLSWHGEVKVSDFGVARAVGASSAVRRIAMLAKRVATVAPEVAQGQKDDPRSDVFSLGVLLHEMLVGPRFPAGMPDAEKLERARTGYVHTTAFGPQLPERLRDVLLRAIAIDPQVRYPHAGMLAYDLRRVAMEMGVGDGRVFLRNAMQNLMDDTENDGFAVTECDDVSDERPVSVRAANDGALPSFDGADTREDDVVTDREG